MSEHSSGNENENDVEVEARLRRAIANRTNAVEPSQGGLTRIEERIMSESSTTNQRQRRWLIGVTSAAAAIAVVLAIVATRDDDTTAPADTTTTTEASSTTSSSATTVPVTVDVASPIWPRVDTSQRFDDPVAAARSFAVDFVGFVDPIVGEFQAGDSRSGEVAIKPAAQGPTTTVLVRQLEDNTWFVLGSSTDDVVLDSPTAGVLIECPVHLTGTALAFEGHVTVAVRADAVEEPIGTGFVTGGGGPAAPFDGTVACDLNVLDDGVHYGAILLTTEGGADSTVWSATVIRVKLK
jgi:hypothetical protein